LDFVDACRRFIATDSTPNAGTVAIANFAAELCQQAGLSVELQEGVIAGVAQSNVIARTDVAPKDGELLLLTHLDTVEAGSFSLWSETDFNPFNASIHGDKIYGLGSANSKLDFLCKLEALKSFDKNKLKVPLILVGTYGEELGMGGTKKLLQHKKIMSAEALVGCPTHMNPVIASNGNAVIDFFIPFSEDERAYKTEHSQRESTSTHSRIFRGRAAHSAQPQMGENAIIKLVSYLNELPSSTTILSIDGGVHHNIVPDQAMIEVDMSRSFKNNLGQKFLRLTRELENLATEFIKYEDKRFSPTMPSYNIGVVRTYEDGLQVIVNLRLTPNVLETVLQSWRQRIKEFCQPMEIRVRVRDYKLPMVMNDASKLLSFGVKILKDLELEPKLSAETATNESSLLMGHGIECLVIGPGQGAGNSHGPNEYNSMKELQRAISFYKRFIGGWCT